MAVFQFPKGRYVRRFKPYQYKHYRSFKRVLQHEFGRVCVYCRAPDSEVPLLFYAFSVDHYRPKGIARFAHLGEKYENLFYACSACNSRKSDYWPIDESKGPYVLNPCDHDMAAHLRLNARSCEYESRSDDGAHMIRLLQLNDADIVAHRRRVISILDATKLHLAKLEKRFELASKRLKSGAITQTVFDELNAIVQEQRTMAVDIVECLGATKPLRPLGRTSP